MRKGSTTIWSNPFIAWVVVFLAVFVIIWLFSSAWFQFTLQAALILLLLYIVIGVPFTWLFFGIRAIYRKNVGQNHKNEVPVTVFILLAIAAAVISMIVSLWYSNDVEKYRDPSKWKEFSILNYEEISNELSNLPAQKIDTD